VITDRLPGECWRVNMSVSTDMPSPRDVARVYSLVTSGQKACPLMRDQLWPVHTMTIPNSQDASCEDLYATSLFGSISVYSNVCLPGVCFALHLITSASTTCYVIMYSDRSHLQDNYVGPQRLKSVKTMIDGCVCENENDKKLNHRIFDHHLTSLHCFYVRLWHWSRIVHSFLRTLYIILW